MVTRGTEAVEPAASALTAGTPSHCAKIPPFAEVLTIAFVDDPVFAHVDFVPLT